VNGWQPHSYVHDPERPRTVILALYIEPEWLTAFRPGWAASGAPGFFKPSVRRGLSAHPRPLAMNLATDMMARPEARQTHEALLSDLMIAVIERFTPWRSFPASIRQMSARAGDWRIRKATASMRSETGRDAGLESIAREVGLSRAHFFRLFEASVGVPPKVYLNVVRMERAVEAVLNQGLSVFRHQQPTWICRARRISTRFFSETTVASRRASSEAFHVSPVEWICGASVRNGPPADIALHTHRAK